MKNSFLIIPLFFFSLFACSSDEKPTQDEEQQKIPPKMQPTAEWPSLLLGTWEFVEQCESQTFGDGYSCSKPSVYEYHFISDNIMITNRFENDEIEGSYQLNGDILHMEFISINHSFSVQIHSLNDEQMILVSSGDDTALYSIYNR